MWSWNQFRNLPRNQKLNAQEQARQYFIHQSNMMMEASSVAAAAASAGAGAGGGGSKKVIPTFTFKSLSNTININLALDIPSDGGSSGSGGESGGIGLDNLVIEFVTVDWGDGTIDSVLETSYMLFSHTYDGESANGTVTIKGRYITTLNLSGNNFTSISTGKLPSSLQELYLQQNQLTDFNPSLPLPSSLQELYLINNQLTDFNPSLPLPSSLQGLYLQQNQLTDFNPSLPLPSGLRVLYLYYNQLTDFNPSLPLPSSLQELYLQQNQLNTLEVNTTLILLDTRYTILENKQFFLTMSPSAPPSGAGLTAKTSLQSKGYNVYTD